MAGQQVVTHLRLGTVTPYKHAASPAEEAERIRLVGKIIYDAIKRDRAEAARAAQASVARLASGNE